MLNEGNFGAEVVGYIFASMSVKGLNGASKWLDFPSLVTEIVNRILFVARQASWSQATTATSRSKETSTVLECTCTSSQGLTHRDAKAHNTCTSTQTHTCMALPLCQVYLYIPVREIVEITEESTQGKQLVCDCAFMCTWVRVREKESRRKIGSLTDWPTV